MPWRLVKFIVIFAVFLLFIGLNIRNKCDISFGFITITDVPVFLTAFSSFFFGMVCAFPFIFGFRARKKAKTMRKEGKRDQKPGRDFTMGQGDGSYYGID